MRSKERTWNDGMIADYAIAQNSFLPPNGQCGPMKASEKIRIGALPIPSDHPSSKFLNGLEFIDMDGKVRAIIAQPSN